MPRRSTPPSSVLQLLRHVPRGIPHLGLAILLISLAFLGGSSQELAQAKEKVKYATLYLTADRVCEKCTWRWVNVGKQYRVELINKKGESTIVYPEEIIGVDNHPILRNLMLKSLAGMGNAGPVIVPYAFENSKDLICKHCDNFQDEQDSHKF